MKENSMKKLFTLLTNDIFIVVLLGIVSTATAWSGVQSSLHGGVSDEALTNYQLNSAEANRLWITAEVKYRDDLSVWKDKQVRLIIDGISKDEIYADVQTSNGSYEFYESAMTCLIAKPTSQLPDCKSYMESLYGPYGEVFDKGETILRESETAGKHSDQLQMLTALFAVSLFMLGVASIIKRQGLICSLAIFSIVITLFGLVILAGVPVLTA
jgi:hypothetical protein